MPCYLKMAVLLVISPSNRRDIVVDPFKRIFLPRQRFLPAASFPSPTSSSFPVSTVKRPPSVDRQTIFVPTPVPFPVQPLSASCATVASPYSEPHPESPSRPRLPRRLSWHSTWRRGSRSLAPSTTRPSMIRSGSTRFKFLPTTVHFADS